jgi:hypothetical protein
LRDHIDPGQHSRDLRALGGKDPAEKDLDPKVHEKRIQRRDQRRLVTGIAAMGVAVLASLVGALVHPGNLTPEALLFAALTIGCLAATGGVLTGVGFAGQAQSPVRAHMRMLSRAIAGAAGQADRNFAMNTRLGVKADESAVQQEAMIEVLTAIVEQMPLLKDQYEWIGFAKAVREGHTEQQTGTDGPGHNRKRLSAVRPHNEKG